MKKIIVALVVLAIAIPAFGTSFTITQISGSEVRISYDASGEGQPVRGFGLDVTVDSNEIVDYSNTSAEYYIFPGSVQVDAAGNISSYGSPIGNDSDHPDTQEGLDSSGVTLEMASLYETTPPATTGDLLDLQVDGDCNISMAGNAARGEVVLEDGSAGTEYPAPVRIWYSTLNSTEYAEWLTWGGGNPANAPANWRDYCWKCGDVDGNGIVLPGDVLATFNYFNDATSNGEGDTNMDGLELPGDVLLTFNRFNGGLGCTPCLPVF